MDLNRIKPRLTAITAASPKSLMVRVISSEVIFRGSEK